MNKKPAIFIAVEFTEEHILFEDNYLLAINKPNGLISESAYPGGASVESLALEYLRQRTKYPAKCFAAVPHRLDAAVSGAITVAKKKSALKTLHQFFAAGNLTKTYLAIVERRPPQAAQQLVHYHQKSLKQHKAIISTGKKANSKEAALTYELIAESEYGFLLKVRLLTGRYHQIRAQLAFIGCPIAGDTLYGATSPYYPNAIALHAWQLQFPHPFSNQPVNVIAPVPNNKQWTSFSVPA